jgi:hypothetical protein
MKFLKILVGFVFFNSYFSLYADLKITPINQANLKGKANNYQYNSTYFLVSENKQNNLKPENIDYYIGNNLYLLALPAGEMFTANNYYSIEPESKIASNIDLSKQSENVQIIYSKSVSKDILEKELSKFNISSLQINSEQNIIKIQLAINQIKDIAKIPFIYSISKDYKEKNTLSYDSYIMNRLSTANFPAPNGFNLNGENMNIGIWDDGIIAPHLNLENFRVFNIDKTFNNSPYYNHPTYVAGAAAMNNNSNYFQKGAASKSKIYAWDYVNDIISEIKKGIQEYQLNVSNHSYNFGQTQCRSASGLYIPDASEIDKLSNTYKDVVHVIAVGNTGHTCAINDTFYSTDIGYQGAKNVITVGYLYRDEKLVETSGRGPTTDGRLKPELVTKGFAYSATSPNSGFATVYGSSFAAPQVAGFATLIQQKYKQQFGSFPPSSLVKAVLCNTAQDLFYEGIDYATGFGRPDVGKAIKNIDQNRFFISTINHQQNNTHQITLQEAQDFLAITLCWTDPASFPFQDTVLINNLDLKLITPNQDTILPWVLNPDLYKQAAIHGVDKLNNIEHITFTNLSAGNYTILVNGTNIPIANQEYALTYYAQKKGIDIVYPDGGENLDASGGTNITWNNYGIFDSIDVYYSIDSGMTWNLIGKTYSTAPYLAWTLPPNISTNAALIKIIGTNLLDSSFRFFNIVPRPSATNLTITACDKNAGLSWTAIPNAQYYNIYLFDNEQWQKIDTTSNLNYKISNLSNGKTYFAAISVTINGIEGNRSNAKSFTPNFVSCGTTNDLGVYYIQKPLGGRANTSTALSNNETITFIIKNYGTNAISNFIISYQLDNGIIGSQVINRSIAINDTLHITSNSTFNLSNIGLYSIKAWTNLPLDINKKNDTLKYIIKHVENNAVTLPWKESFESKTSTITENTFAIDNMLYADYYTTTNGRWRTDRGNLYAQSGINALTLDNINTSGSVTNQHHITLNLQNYIDSIVYVDFSFMQHSETSAEDTLFARGNDTSNWIPIYNIYDNKTENGIYKNVKAINLYKILKIENNQDFSSSTQLKIQTLNTSNATELGKNGGYTFDDICVYTANRDIENISQYTLRFPICLDNSKLIPISIKILNNSNQILNNIAVGYSVNNGNSVSESINQILLPFDTLTYTFNQQLLITQAGRYDVRTFIQQNNDQYKLNDTSKVLTFIANQYITTLPYLNTFEQDASLLSYGTNNSWTHGTPYKYYTRLAAEDQKSWSNSLFGNYNYNEKSELYLGCYNFQNLSTYPSIAFHQLQNIQTLYDSVWAEYSLDGSVWNRLGCANCGTNWYNNTNGTNKWDRTLVPWQVASTKIIIDPSIDKSKTLIRLRLSSNENAVGEGFALDDLHVYVSDKQIAPSDSVYVTTSSNGNGWIDIIKNGLLVAQIYDDNKNLGNIEVGYKANNTTEYFLDRTLLPRHWSIVTQNNVSGNYKIRFYVLNAEYLKLINNDPNAFSMNNIAAIRYNGFGVDVIKENNYINGSFDYIPQDSIHFVPFEEGYYVELQTDKFGEFYLVGSTINQTLANFPKFLTIDAQQLNNDTYLNWEVSKDNQIRNYVIQYSLDGIHFFNIDSIISSQSADEISNYGFIHNLNAVSGTLLYYRIQANLLNGNSIFSFVDSIKFDLATKITENTQYIKSYFNNNNIIIENKNILKGNYNIMLVQLDGKVIQTQKAFFENGDFYFNISSNLLSKNIYILRISNNKQTYFSKLLKP